MSWLLLLYLIFKSMTSALLQLKTIYWSTLYGLNWISSMVTGTSWNALAAVTMERWSWVVLRVKQRKMRVCYSGILRTTRLLGNLNSTTSQLINSNSLRLTDTSQRCPRIARSPFTLDQRKQQQTRVKTDRRKLLHTNSHIPINRTRASFTLSVSQVTRNGLWPAHVISVSRSIVSWKRKSFSRSSLQPQWPQSPSDLRRMQM